MLPQDARPLIERPYPLPPLPSDQYYVEHEDAAAAERERLWFVDETDPFNHVAYRLQSVVHRGGTARQEVFIGETYNFGRMLALNGAVQSCEDDESLYHELLAQPALLAHPDARDVLIVGGGTGGALCETLVHRSVRSATVVDFDRELVELAREHLIDWHRGAFADPRVRMVYEDGRRFVEDDDGQYDVVIVDVMTLRHMRAEALYSRQFHEALRRRLRTDGLIAVQGMKATFTDPYHHLAVLQTLKTVYPEVHGYRAQIPSLMACWGFALASDWFDPRGWTSDQVDRAIASKLGTQWLDHLDGCFLRARFARSKEWELLLEQPSPVFDDDFPYSRPPRLARRAEKPRPSPG